MSLSLNVCLSLLGCSALPPQCFNTPSFLKKKKKDKLPHFLSIYLSRSEGLVTTQHNLKGKNQIKTTFFPHCVCTVQQRELLGSEKQPGKLLLRKGNLFPRIYLETVQWELSCQSAVTFEGLDLRVQTRQKYLPILHNLWQRIMGMSSRPGFVSMVAIHQLVHITVCFHHSCLWKINYGAPVLWVSVLLSWVSIKLSPSI